MTQIFEVLEVREFPFFVTIEIDDVSKVDDVINFTNSRKVYLLVDHNKKKYGHITGEIALSNFKFMVES